MTAESLSQRIAEHRDACHMEGLCCMQSPWLNEVQALEAALAAERALSAKLESALRVSADPRFRFAVSEALADYAKHVSRNSAGSGATGAAQ